MNPWVRYEHPEPTDDGTWYRCVVDDGMLRACVEQQEGRWHLSMSFMDHGNEISRYPTWEELRYGRDYLLPHDLTFAMPLPPIDNMIAVHIYQIGESDAEDT
jgi:hypothetical protein